MNGKTECDRSIRLIVLAVLALVACGGRASAQWSWDGASPLAALTLASDGDFYGTTAIGGTYGNGTLFKITPSGAFTLLYAFSGRGGAMPAGRLILGADGVSLFGTTEAGGVEDYCGIVFKYNPKGKMTALYSFGAGMAGSNPRAGLTLYKDGSYYGTTSEGGIVPSGSDNGAGTVFKITPDGKYTTLHNFSGEDGANPLAALTLARDGNFYGTTGGGGTYDSGTIFRITPSGAFTMVYSFTNSDGLYPAAGLTLGSDGKLYGTTVYGGLFDQGIVFRITLSGLFTTLYSFGDGGHGSGADGIEPQADLLLGRDGDFYGTTTRGGLLGAGTVFKITPKGKLTTLHSFSYADGKFPLAGLTQGAVGTLFGTTSEGGAYDNGTVFKITVSGDLSTLWSF